LSETIMLQRLRTARGVVRSLRIYYGDRDRDAAMDRLYAQFIRAGDLVFDIGAHVGDRVAAFRRLGARVVAVEPQPALAATLRWLYGCDPRVVIEATAVGPRCGAITLSLNLDNPTVSTASEAFIAAARQAHGWERETWSARIRTPMTTLDALIARHGLPQFAKIDVEGYEAEVLAGLGQTLPGLSFEFTTIQRPVAEAAIARCAALGLSRFNAALGETHILAFARWRSAEEIARWLRDLPHAANSGDIYAMPASAAAV
jgi:FkbM family methyltransferase